MISFYCGKTAEIKMNKIALSLYVIGTVMIIKSIFRFGFIEGFTTIVLGGVFIVAAYYIDKYTRRY
ncbi:MAG: hypothetical protein B0W54_01165 [Cellvibrio sp. 79]|nr:MAG: hypothetical protein B0W54_01165 [Cellvibrio sp. 79]